MKSGVEVGEIVHLSPFSTRNKALGGCLLVVTEVKTWGVQGYIQGFGSSEAVGGQVYYRAKWEEFESTGGHAAWIPSPDSKLFDDSPCAECGGSGRIAIDAGDDEDVYVACRGCAMKETK